MQGVIERMVAALGCATPCGMMPAVPRSSLSYSISHTQLKKLKRSEELETATKHAHTGLGTYIEGLFPDARSTLAKFGQCH